MAAVAGPTFLGIGAQKAGTTWLYRMLKRHPDIGMPEQKELHFWDKHEPEPAVVDRYLNSFAGLHGRARGEITPSYAILPSERIAAVHRHLPELRLLFVMRNPIERAWSQARMELARALHRGEAIPESAWSQWLTAQLGSVGSLRRGDYAACLRNWLQHYPREGLMVTVHEENHRAPRDFLTACARHLGVDADFYANLTSASLDETVLPETVLLRFQPVDLPPKPPRLYAEGLLKLYAPLVRETEELLGRPLADLWLAGYR
jgi:sulfotransferase family protein